MSDIAFSYLVVIPRLILRNANAISSPLTHGFPSITAFLGLMWALERKLKQAGMDIPLNAIGVVCHDHNEQVSDGGFIKTFRLTRNPVDKTGKTAAIVEEGRINLDISLVFAVNPKSWRDEYPRAIADVLACMRIAGGSIYPPEKPWLRRYLPWAVPMKGSEADREHEFKHVCRKLLPGFALVSRDDLLERRLLDLQQKNPKASRLDAWLSLSRINWCYEAKADDGKGAWQHDRVGIGWIVPIPVGYGALGELHPAGAVANARDSYTPFCFVESLYSLGEWVAPHHLKSSADLLWYADSQPEDGLYRCRNNYSFNSNNPIHRD